MGKTKPRLKDYEEELHKHRMTKSQLSTEKVRGLNLLNNLSMGHPVLKRQDRPGKEPFAGFGTVVEDPK